VTFKMAQSSEFILLEKNIRLIDAVLRNFKQSNASSSRNQIKLKAVLSLVHSEFESYFEQLTLSVVRKFEEGRLSKSASNKVRKNLLLYNLKAYEGSSQLSKQRLQSSLDTLKTRVQQNNGIKEKDILSLLQPIGVSSSKIDSVWLASMSSFGVLRGKLIHSSMSQITRLIGYQYVDETVFNILLNGLRSLDEEMAETYEL